MDAVRNPTARPAEACARVDLPRAAMLPPVTLPVAVLYCIQYLPIWKHLHVV